MSHGAGGPATPAAAQPPPARSGTASRNVNAITPLVFNVSPRSPFTASVCRKVEAK